jgi:tetratricopeptide (TPR) repeat protein
MRGATMALLVMLGIGTALAVAEEPVYQRALKGDDAKKAEALGKRIGERWAAGQFAEAVAPAEELRDLRRRVQGKDHWEASNDARLVETLRQAAALPAPKRVALTEVPATNTKADELDQRGQYAQAEPLRRKALAAREEALGPRHPDTAGSYNGLALNLIAQGRAQEAEPLLRKALAIYEEVLEPQHPNTAICYGNLGHNLDAQGRSTEAEPLLRRVAAVFEEVLGPRHPHTAQSYNNLAANLHVQGRVKEAEPLYRKGLAIQQEVLGPKHPLTAFTGPSLDNEPFCPVDPSKGYE